MKILKCDIRGVYKEDIDEELAFNLGQSALIYAFRRLHQDTSIRVVVGGDVRPSTSGLKKSLIDGMRSIGGNIIDIGIVPSPVFHFANKYFNTNLGVMITASHNPPEYNGFKIDIDGKSTDEQELKEIFEIFQTGKFRRGRQKGKIEKINMLDIYEESLLKKINYSGNLKIVIDAGNGNQSELAPSVFEKFGHKVVRLYCEPDGNFPNRLPNPAVKDNLVELSKKVREENADLGVGFDGDGDRIAFVNNKGIYIENDRIMAIFAKYFLEGQPNEKIVYDIKCSKAVSDVIEQNHGVGLVERSGHSFIRLRVMKEKAIFGGELSGHFFFKILGGEDDSLFAGLLLCKIIQETQKTLVDLESKIPTYFSTPDIRIPFDMVLADKLLAEIPDRFKDFSVMTIDGLKVIFNYGWALIRKSTTEPLLTLRFEAKDRYKLKDVINLVATRIPEIKDMIFDYVSVV
ncbi:MAG: phosphomannomutase/phosphoglucomutase [Candidatus Firestonebacteria bacterium]